MSLINKKAKYKYQQNINYLEIHIVYLEELLKQEKEKKDKLLEWLNNEIENVSKNIDNNRNMIAEQETKYIFANEDYYDKMKHDIGKLDVLKKVKGVIEND